MTELTTLPAAEVECEHLRRALAVAMQRYALAAQRIRETAAYLDRESVAGLIDPVEVRDRLLFDGPE